MIEYENKYTQKSNILYYLVHYLENYRCYKNNVKWEIKVFCLLNLQDEYETVRMQIDVLYLELLNAFQSKIFIRNTRIMVLCPIYDGF
jgi:hypothetical protein